MPTKKGAFSPDNLAAEDEHGTWQGGRGQFPGGLGPYSKNDVNLDYRSEFGIGEAPGGTYALTGVFGPEENDGFAAPVPRKPGHKRL